MEYRAVNFSYIDLETREETYVPSQKKRKIHSFHREPNAAGTSILSERMVAGTPSSASKHRHFPEKGNRTSPVFLGLG